MTPKWITFREDPVPFGRKTKHWTILTKDSETWLGSVSWYGPWRKYTFTPTIDFPTVFEEDCLRDIASFVEEQTRAQRAEAKARREAAL